MQKPGPRLAYLWAFGLFFVSSLFLAPRRSSRIKRPVLAVLLLMSLGCGGGSSGGGGGGGGGGGTPVGTYSVTITVTSGSLSHSTVLSLTVN